ncbi:hypothetical protein [Streptomyces violascens]|uniref:hypothetical protein n=1 Tax=Streptomyces violascens TaxID=67381 RepID=UPI0016793427|nr:hypothetical protein [Streptomyces violascens]GGU41021.1 hypothetical protein GCM10010289_72400 [Streptomyces violascens]
MSTSRRPLGTGPRPADAAEQPARTVDLRIAAERVAAAPAVERAARPWLAGRRSLGSGPETGF